MATRTPAKNGRNAAPAPAPATPAKPERYRGFLAATGLAGGSVPYISPADLSDAGSFDVVHVGKRMGTDMDGNPQREVYFDVALIEGISGDGESKAQRLSMRETDQRIEQAKAMFRLFHDGHERVGPFRLEKFTPEKGNAFWTLEDVDPAPLVEQWGYVIPPCHPAASETAPAQPSQPAQPAQPAAGELADENGDLPF